MGLFHLIDTFAEYENGAFDEDGAAVICDCCGHDIGWDPINKQWDCLNCGRVLKRKEYFNYIGAHPKRKCIKCNRNYPQCRETCTGPDEI